MYFHCSCQFCNIVLSPLIRASLTLTCRSNIFDSNASTVICDSSANVHICNDRNMFVGDIGKLEQHFVVTIGGNQNNASGISMVQWIWKDDTGKAHTFDVKDVLFPPSTPINIVSMMELAEQLNDDTCTGMKTIRRKSTFFGAVTNSVAQ